MDGKNQNPPVQLDYKLISEYYLGALAGGLRDHILEIVVEAFHAYQAGCFRSTIILSAEIVYRLNIELIIKMARVAGEIKYKGHCIKSSEALIPYKLVEKLMGDHNGLSFNDTINLLDNLGILDHQLILDMHALRFIRNTSIHNVFLPMITWNNYRAGTSFEDQIRLTIGGIPTHLRVWEFEILFGKEKRTYKIDQERLNISIDGMPDEQQFAVFSLGVLLFHIKNITQQLTTKTEISPIHEIIYDKEENGITLHISNDGKLIFHESDMEELIDRALMDARGGHLPKISIIFERKSQVLNPDDQIAPGIYQNTIPYSGLEQLLAKRIKYIFHSKLFPYYRSNDQIIESIQALIDKFFFGTRIRNFDRFLLDVINVDLVEEYHDLSFVLEPDDQYLEGIIAAYQKTTIKNKLKVTELPFQLMYNEVIPTIILKSIRTFEENPDLDLDSLLDLSKWAIAGPH